MYKYALLEISPIVHIHRQIVNFSMADGITLSIKEGELL